MERDRQSTNKPERKLKKKTGNYKRNDSYKQSDVTGNCVETGGKGRIVLLWFPWSEGYFQRNHFQMASIDNVVIVSIYTSVF